MIPIQLISENEKEQQLAEQFIDSVTKSQSFTFRSTLRKLFKEYSSISSGDSILTRTKDTYWINEWRKSVSHLSTSSKNDRLRTLKRFMNYHYKNGNIDYDIYELLEVGNTKSESDLSFPDLKFSIQRELEYWQVGWIFIGERRKLTNRSMVLKFSVFSSGMPGHWPTIEMIRNWLLSMKPRLQMRYIWDYAWTLNKFLNYLLKKGLIKDNPIAQILEEYPNRGFKGIVWALCNDDWQFELQKLRPKIFRSYLSMQFTEYLKVKRATGRIYGHQETMLRMLDNFLDDNQYQLTHNSFQEWINSLSHLHSTTQCHYYQQIRQFCEYMQRTDVNIFVPQRRFEPLITPSRMPAILDKKDILKLIKSTDTLFENDRWPLRRLTFRVIITILYCCGLRVGEIVRLNIGDVDIKNGVLTIRDTKFFKSRFVPMSEPVTQLLAEYLKRKKDLQQPGDFNSPLFYSSRRRRYFIGTIKQTVKNLISNCCQKNIHNRSVRVHDLRHTYAIHRLIEWYENGEDVQAKLPILSQYLGHSEIGNTQRYLSLIPELSGTAMKQYKTYAVKIRSINNE